MLSEKVNVNKKKINTLKCFRKENEFNATRKWKR